MATFKIKYTLTFIRNPIYPIKIEFQQHRRRRNTLRAYWLLCTYIDASFGSDFVGVLEYVLISQSLFTINELTLIR